MSSEGPLRPIVAVLERYTSKGRYGTAAKGQRERVRLDCGHERAWYAGRTHARCSLCGRSGAPAPRLTKPAAVAAPTKPVLSPEQALQQYNRLLNKLAWKAARQLPPTSTFSQPDLYQEGVVITLRSLTRYKPTKAAFITYLYVSLVNRYGQILKREWREATGLPRVSLTRFGRVRDGEETLDIPVEPEQESRLPLLDLVTLRVGRRPPSWRGSVA